MIRDKHLDNDDDVLRDAETNKQTNKHIHTYIHTYKHTHNQTHTHIYTNLTTGATLLPRLLDVSKGPKTREQQREIHEGIRKLLNGKIWDRNRKPARIPQIAV